MPRTFHTLAKGQSMLKKLARGIANRITTKLLASVDFWNFQESIESRMTAIESRMAAAENRLDTGEKLADYRLDTAENRLNTAENRLNTAENRLNINEGLLDTFYNPYRTDSVTVNLISHLIKVLITSNPSGKEFTRLGSKGDGGYVLLDDLDASDILFSIGVGDNVSFDQECEQKVSKVILVDHTVPNFIVPTGRFEMIRKPLVPDELSNLGISISQMLNRYREANDFILKMDIEGAEWEILEKVAQDDIVKFRQIVIEFHGLNDLSETGKLNNKIAIIERLLLTHTPVVLHANNQGTYRLIGDKIVPDVIEVTLLRKSSYDLHSGYNSDIQSLLQPNSKELPNLWIDWIDVFTTR